MSFVLNRSTTLLICYNKKYKFVIMDKIKLVFVIPPILLRDNINKFIDDTTTSIREKLDKTLEKLSPRYHFRNIKKKIVLSRISLNTKKHYGTLIVKRNQLAKVNAEIITSIMIRTSLKLGVAAGAVYFTVENGVWKDSETTQKLYNELGENLAPYTNEIRKQFPPMPDITVTMSPLTWWNEGVKATCSFLNNAPGYISEYSNQLANHPEVKKMFDSIKSVNIETTEAK